MRIQILSDLHLDHSPGPSGRIIAPWRIPATSCDVVVVAGDWCHSWDDRVTDAIKDVRQPLVTVLGNHDWYALDVAIEDHFWRNNLSSRKDNVYLLNPGFFDVGNVRFIGCTWWAGLAWSERTTEGRLLSQEALVRGIGCAINDFKWIQHDGTMFTCENMLAIHQRETAWLQTAISEGRSAGKGLVVVTHFSPSRKSISEKFKGHLINPYFHNDRDDLTEGVDLWIHGHTHVNCDYVIPRTGCRVLCNPKGYASENPRFLKGLVVELPLG
jgi:predicted phosphodiesterase